MLNWHHYHFVYDIHYYAEFPLMIDIINFTVARVLGQSVFL